MEPSLAEVLRDARLSSCEHAHTNLTDPQFCSPCLAAVVLEHLASSVPPSKEAISTAAVSARYSLARMAGTHAIDAERGWDSSTMAAFSRSWQDVYFLYAEVKRLRLELAEQPAELLADSPAGQKYIDGHMNGFRAGWESAWSTRMVGAGFAAPELSGHAAPPRELFDAIKLVDDTLKAHPARHYRRVPPPGGDMAYLAGCDCRHAFSEHQRERRAIADAREHQAIEVARAFGMVLHARPIRDERLDRVEVCRNCAETRAEHEHYSGACQARKSGNTRWEPK